MSWCVRDFLLSIIDYWCDIKIIELDDIFVTWDLSLGTCVYSKVMMIEQL